ncbi:MAG: serine/threonine protein kinase [Planctomycetes bacterium]|nr:serine/threonine protein kinase [Planctomycetota bacterium]
METARDKGLAQAAVAQRLVSLEKMQECLDEMKLAEGDGSSATLDELLVKKGLISRRQADGLLEGLARKALPKEIGGFQIIEPVGTGGMHTVYKARQMSMDRIVALKILSPKVAQNNKYVQRLFKEARAVAKLSHPNIIQGIDVGEDLGYFYFAAEFIEGESLGDSLEREHSLGEYNALRIAEQVCLALCHIQQHANMIHGDIKPANIMLTRAGVAKLADLGLARAVGGSEIITAGTPHYISPEQLHNSPDVDIRSDIYSLGATLFHMVTGSPPYLGPNAKAIGLKHISEPIPEVRAPNAQLSLGICRLITKMLAKDPADRHQTPAEVLNDIHRVQQGMMPAGALVFARVDAHRTASRRSVNPVLPIAIVLIVLGGIAAAVAFSNKGTGPPPPPTSKNVLAAEAYADAVAFEKEHPEALAKVISRYDSVASRYKFTDWGKKAGQRSEEKRTTRQALAETKFLQVKQKADALAAKGRYAEAAAALDEYPRRLRFGEWPDQIRTERRKHRDAARAREEKQLEKAAALADEQHYEEATKVLQPLLESDITDIVRRAEEQIAK